MHAAPDSPAPSRAALVVAWAEGAAACAVLAAVVLVPLVSTNTTPYALDLKWPVSGACALAAGLALVVRWAAGGRLAPRTAAVTRVLAVFFGAVLLAAACSRYRAVAVREAWWYAAHIVFFLAAAVAVRRQRAWRTALLAVILVTATFEAVSGWSQWFGTDLFGRTWWRGTRRIALGRGMRVLGTISSETALGGYMALCSVCALGLAVSVRNLAARIGLGGAGLLMAGCMVLTGSRGAWIGFLVGLVVLYAYAELPGPRRLLRTWGGRAALGAGVLGVAVAVLQLWGVIWPRLSTLWRHLPIRLTIWHAALRMFYHSPVVGFGPGTFRRYFPLFRPEHFGKRGVGLCTLLAHSEYLEVAVETGMLGLVPFALFLGLWYQATRRTLENADGAAPPGPLPAVFAGTVALLVHAAGSVNTRYPTCRLILWVMLGLAAAYWREAEPDGGRAPRPVSPWRSVPVLLAVLAAAPVVWHWHVWRPYRARQLLREAADRQRVGAWAKSIWSARRALERDPTSVPAQYVLANSLFLAGAYDAALAAFAELEARSPHHWDIDLRMGVLYALLGDVPHARARLDLACRYGMAYGAFLKYESMSDAELRRLAERYASEERAKMGGRRRARSTSAAPHCSAPAHGLE